MSGLVASSGRDRAVGPNVIGGVELATEVTWRLSQRVLARCSHDEQALRELLYETIYREQQRLGHAEPDPRSAGDQRFFRHLRRELARAPAGSDARLVNAVIARYAREISGHFDPHVYAFATGLVPPALGALLHGGRPSLHLFDVDDRILLEGDVAGLEHAARTGTVVLVPTHVSNLDSLVLGYTIFRLGLPPFAYGAGLNLFSNALIGYFMRNLGAFTIDRKKNDPLYLEAVKEYTTMLLERGQHLLFFPGGTRSRSGALEGHLKLGLLSKIVTAFANRRARDPHSAPVYVVPCTLSYPLVLEAASLIDEYLSREGGPHFVDVRDEFERPARWYEFLRGLAELDVQIHVRFASPLDPIGNRVDAAGCSRDRRGRALDPERYLHVDGVVCADEARDAEYTKLLAASVIDAYRRESVALPSSVLAFALFTCLARAFPELDLFRLLRVLGERASVARAELEAEIDIVLGALHAAAARGAIALAPELEHGTRASVIERGAATLATYHRPPLLARNGDRFEVLAPNLLWYYRNRLEGFGLPGISALQLRSPGASTWSAA